MSRNNIPADLAQDAIRILKKKKFDLPRPSYGDGYPAAIAEIAEKICAGADLGALAEFTNKWKEGHRQHFIHRDQTLLHLFADVSPNSMDKDEYEAVLNAMKRLVVPNPDTGTLYFDLEHHDDVYGHTPLHLAARSATPAMCQVLLEAGADVTALSTGGCFKSDPETPLVTALWAKNYDTAQVLRTWLAKQAVDQVIKQNENAPATGASQP